jgi:hypothetical protein
VCDAGWPPAARKSARISIGARLSTKKETLIELALDRGKTISVRSGKSEDRARPVEQGRALVGQAAHSPFEIRLNREPVSTHEADRLIACSSKLHRRVTRAPQMSSEVREMTAPEYTLSGVINALCSSGGPEWLRCSER